MLVELGKSCTIEIYFVLFAKVNYLEPISIFFEKKFYNPIFKNEAATQVGCICTNGHKIAPS